MVTTNRPRIELKIEEIAKPIEPETVTIEDNETDKNSSDLLSVEKTRCNTSMDTHDESFESQQ